VHTVFHVASIVDLSPFVAPRMADINIEGTRTLLAACRDHGVSFFVYTSSIDVVFSGKPVANGDETLPRISSPELCPYGWTKAEAEKLVLAADGGKMRTVAIRPGHIYGPGDFMISQILSLVAEVRACNHVCVCVCVCVSV
jgi:nucleoside-diphosphate-sugar epimerase